jgi:hypothetical protein
MHKPLEWCGNPHRSRIIYESDCTMVKSIIIGVSTYYAGRHSDLSAKGETTSIQNTYTFSSLSISLRDESLLKWLQRDQLVSTTITLNSDGSQGERAFLFPIIS